LGIRCFPFCLHDLNIFVFTVLMVYFKIFSFLLWSNEMYPAVCLMNFISVVFSLLALFCFNVHRFHSYIKVTR
jgi:uncharacterized membrane protein